MNYVVLVKTNIDNNIKHNSIEKIPYKGKISLESMYKLPFCESEANGIIKCLKRINEHIKDMQFKVQEPIMTFRTF